MSAPFGTAERLVFGPQAGPQTAFMATPADIALYGGGAGGGKTWAEVFKAAQYTHVPGYAAVIFRRESVQLVGGGSIWEEAQGIYPHLGGKAVQGPVLKWRFPAGSQIEFRHLQREADKHAHQGKQYSAIFFDELTHFTETQFWYLISRLRSTCGVRPFLRATCNPDPDSFVRKLVAWWIGPDGRVIPERSGVIRWIARVGDVLHWADRPEELTERFGEHVSPMSFTFIASSLTDNPALTSKDPGYAGRLAALPLVERERLLGCNWDIRPAAGNHFRRTWFNLVEADDPIINQVVAWVRAWDFAATEPSADNPDPDWTAGALVGVTKDGRYVIRHIARGRWSPGKVRDAVKRHAQHDGRGTHVCLWQDPGQAGKDQMEAYRVHMAGFALKTQVASQNKLAYADIWSPLVEQGKVYVVRGPANDPWHEAFFLEGDGFPDGKYDDQIDAVSRAMLELTERFKHKRANEAWKKAVV